MNIRTGFEREAEKSFMQLLYARSVDKFDEIMNFLDRTGGKAAELATYLRNICSEGYSRSMFPLPRFGKVTSNVAKSINATMKHIRQNAVFKYGIDASERFNSIWKLASIAGIYENTSVHAFALDELGLVFGCKASPMAVKHGRHRIVRIPNGGGTCGHGLAGAADTINLEFSLSDNLTQTQHFPSEPSTRGVSGNGLMSASRAGGPGNRGERTRTSIPSSKKLQCDICKQTGHNMRTCPISKGARMEDMEDSVEPIATQQPQQTPFSTDIHFNASSDSRESKIELPEHE
ncbi:hypothetical protein R1sor_010179 [Riccia sorocarpa]|uniref:CCHC-type domain-containing protein n=1 Tax=Riccia sorocarpa TaxID=122646 RepID=A0ABD3HXC7_9MARC